MSKKKNEINDEMQTDEAMDACGEQSEKLAVAQLYEALCEARAKVDECEEKAAKAADYALKMQADFENFKRRNAEQSAKHREDGMAEVVTKFIPICDVIGQALKMINDEKVAEGVRMISRQIDEIFTSIGVTEISALGKPFDPNFHNAVMQVNVTNADQVGTVVEVFQKGYMMGNRILRFSAVKVGTQG